MTRKWVRDLVWVWLPLPLGIRIAIWRLIGGS